MTTIPVALLTFLYGVCRAWAGLSVQASAAYTAAIATGCVASIHAAL